jgi:integrase
MAYAEKRGKGEFPWRVKFKLPGGKEDSASGFRTRQDALNHGRDQEADIRHGRYHDPRRGEITLGELFAKWLPAQDISERAARTRTTQYNAQLKPRWGDTPIRELDAFDVAQFDKQLHAGRSKSHADAVMELLRMMLGDAMAAGYIQMSPVAPKKRRGTREPSKARVGVVVPLETVLAIGERMPEAYALLVLLIAFTGMRWGEAAGLRRSFLTLLPAANGKPASGRYVIDKDVGAVHQAANGDRFFAWPKGRKGRVIELPAFLVEQLLDYLATIPAERDLLFVNTLGDALNYQRFSDSHWRKACDGWVGRKRIRGEFVADAGPVALGLVPHDLRHTHKTWLAEDGVEPVARDERLGHATPGMDGVYIHATDAMRVRVLERLQARWENHRS